MLPKALSTQFRHIVFPGCTSRRSTVVNFATSGEITLPQPREDAAFLREHAVFVDWLFSEAQLDLRQYRLETLCRRLPACLRAVRARSVDEARQRIMDDPLLLAPALSALVIGVTSLFRDENVFRQLRAEVLPELDQDRPVFCWSAGCSDGAEIYSLAILLAERNLLPRTYLLGTDCRADAIDRARLGRFDALAARTVPPDMLRTYFMPVANGWQIMDHLRQSTHWRCSNVLQGLEPGIWDMILFRNVAMYMRSEATTPLWERIEAALRPGGFLVLGKAERPMGAKRLTPVGPCIYRRIRG